MISLLRSLKNMLARLSELWDEDFIWVERDGSARELTNEELEMLARPIDAPNFKKNYESWDEFMGVAGLLERSKLPEGVVVQPVDPEAKLQGQYSDEFEEWIKKREQGLGHNE